LNEDGQQYGAKDIRFATKGDALYALVLGWPADGRTFVCSLGKAAGAVSGVSLLGHRVATAVHMLGSWQDRGEIFEGADAGTSFHSQSTCVILAPGKPEGCLVYLGDRWFPDKLQDSRYVWWPLIVKPDGSVRVKAGATRDRLVCLNDLMATCAELVGVVLPDNAGEDRVSFLPVLLGTAALPAREAVVHHRINGKFAIREGRWKLALYAGSGGWGKPGDGEAEKGGLPAVQLYELEADAGETKNVCAEHPEVVARLTALLEKYVTDGRSTPGAAQANDTVVVPVSRGGVGSRK
jgi:hypothetical protein